MGEHADNTDTPSFHSIELGLRRDHRIHNTIKGWNLPKLMTNPPEVCPPHGVPVATLSSIDVRLEYCLRVAKATTAHLLEERVVQVIPGQIHGETCLKAFGPWPSHISEHRLGLSHEEALQLFELGFQNLVVSRPTKHPSIRTVKQTIEKCLMDLSPAVFNLQYRDVSSCSAEETHKANANFVRCS